MQKKQVSIIPKGIQQDLAVSQFPADAAYNIRNMRITTTGDNTSLCLVNEKSNSKVLEIQGTVIGTQIINNHIILFITGLGDNKPDAIYKIISVNGNLEEPSILYRGDLNFSTNHPIECIGIYENEDIQKIYWVDGINQPRLINIKNTYSEENNSQFDFIPKIINTNGAIQVEVSTEFGANAIFDGGVIQYAVAYFNKYGQETPTIYQSPLYYTSDNGRGLNPDGTQKALISFKLTIKNINKDYNYCRIYRIMRTSIDTTPSVEYIGDYSSDSFYESGNISTLTSNSFTKIKYGKEGTYTGTGSLLDMMEDFLEKVKVDDFEYPNIVIINSVGLHNQNPDTNKDFYIQASSGTDTIQLLIPKDKIVRLQWEKAEDRFDLTKRYFISIGDEEDPFNYSSEEYITIINDGILIYDTGTTGTNIDPSELLYLGGTELIAGTITHKDGTLFLGNVSIEKSFISKEDKESIEYKSTLEYILEENINNDDNNSYLDIQWNTNSNLLKSNKEVTFFQKGEVYRFGVQFLSKVGVWSEVVYLGDKENSLRVVPNTYNDGISQRPIMKAQVHIPKNVKEKYTAARLVCVYPTIQDRNVLCQGIVCPTVYNLKDRDDNSPYVQSSWFARPSYSKYTVFSNDSLIDKVSYKKGSHLEYRMVGSNQRNSVYYEDAVIGLPDSEYINSEIYGVVNNPDAMDYTDSSENPTRETVIRDYKNAHGVEKRIVTLHSPELDDAFNDELQNISLQGLKFRVVGFAPVKTTLSDIDISYTNPFIPNHSGVYNDDIKSPSDSDNHISGFSLVNFPLWVDGTAVDTNETFPGTPYGMIMISSYPVYPWHRNGSLSNQGKTDTAENRKSLLKTKVMSSLRICLPSVYSLSEEYNMEISNVELWNNTSTTNTIKVLNTSNLWGTSTNIIYKGDIDRVLTCEGNGKYDEHQIRINGYFDIYKDSGNYLNIIPELLDNILSPRDNFKYIKIEDMVDREGHHFGEYVKDRNKYSSDPIPIQYRSTGHAVFAFGKVKEGEHKGRYEILPNISTDGIINETRVYPYINDTYGSYPMPPVWLSKDEVDSYNGIYQKELHSDSPILNFHAKQPAFFDDNDEGAYYFIIGELYRDNVVNRFGGNTEQAKANNSWCPCGDTVYFTNLNTITLYGNQGDTFLGRYDHLKTYPLANDNINRIVDIVSFCCETRINVDGRYDRNRGNKNNLAVSPSNFNLFNKVYSQRNNFFSGTYLRKDEMSVLKFPNQIMWSKTKTLGENIDSWTNINATNVMDLDGDKGELQILKRFNNEIYAFQNTGISRIIFNPRVQINTSDNIPIEIANSGKVEGKIYITDKYGCQNKWSMEETPSGLYFIDDLNKSILTFNGQTITDLTYTKNMYSWIHKNSSLNIWNPKEYDAIRIFYDKNNSDVYFTTKNDSLAFNEKLGAFSSFYDYGKVDWVFSVGNTTYQIKDNTIWKLHGGDNYNTFFEDDKNYSISIIANPEFQLDKVFDTVEFRTNGVEQFTHWNTSNYPFNSIVTTNEYQTATSNTNSLKKKFRTWRWQIGRDKNSKRDRIRNPWAKITMSGNSKEEVRLYDIAVTYYT